MVGKAFGSKGVAMAADVIPRSKPIPSDKSAFLAGGGGSVDVCSSVKYFLHYFTGFIDFEV